MTRYDATLTRLHALYPKLIDLRLDRLRRLLAALGNPEQNLPPVIHVAGTNGKGSVCAFARAIAEAAGLSVHVYTSPHLVRFNERIRLAGDLVQDEALAAALDDIESVNAGNQITVFEAITAAAFLLFSRTPADLCLLEVGLGGRFDATNVIPPPAACAITSISLDHQDFLGDTIAQIAAEKAGIIKPNIPVVTGHQPTAAMRVIAAEAAARNAPLSRRGIEWDIESHQDGLTFAGMTLPPPALPGAHQVENAGIAIMSLRAAGVSANRDAIATGLQTAEWPARLQRLHGALAAQLPPGSELWLDGAHNPGGATALAAQLAAWPGPTTLICGMKQSKDAATFLQILQAARPANIFAVAEPDQHLALPVDAIIAASGNQARPGPTIAAALSQIPHPTRVLICGSLYLAGEALKLDASLNHSSPPQ